MHSVSCEIGGKSLTIETGKLAKQAHGSVMVSYGDTRVLVTVCSSQTPKAGIDFFPLTVEFAERFYAAGKIPGSFHKREGRPTQEATLSARQIDRPIRPLFPEGYYYETQLVVTVLSVDPEADVDVAAAAGASAALSISDVPFAGPTAACRMGRVGGAWVINPTWKQIESGETDLEIFVAGTAHAVMMVEGGAREISEADALEAIVRAHAEIKNVTACIEQLRALCGKKKREVSVSDTSALDAQVAQHAESLIRDALNVKDKIVRHERIADAIAQVRLALSDMDGSQLDASCDRLQYKLMRSMILDDKKRIDGRDMVSVRPITVEAGILPRPHGSALFTRGETQVLAAVTLGTSDDEQIVDTMFQSAMRKFMLHYNFPPFSVGETGRMGGQSRREIGHGALAERSVKALMPSYESFPYTVRIVCETLESNGSSSMGSVCSASMALMHAGVPFTKPVAGIAMGLIKEQEKVAILTDILGDEDHLGDMDFKVAGTAKGITGIQMDIKIEGVDETIMRRALAQARDGRLHILGQMAHAITEPRKALSAFAPQITSIMVPIDKIRDVIGSGGKVIKDIIAQTGCKIDINDDGKVNICSADAEAAQKAMDIIRGLVAKVEVGTTYRGIVKKVVDFGAFVSVIGTQEGLLHVSEIAHERVQFVADYLKEGQEIDVKVIEVDKHGKIRLSRKAILPLSEKKI